MTAGDRDELADDADDDRDLLTADALAALPLFPLDDVVLLPGALLPLHVFEPRYREMTRDALDGHQLVCMTRIASDDDPPAVTPVAGVGKIIACRETDDGRYYVLLRGVARVHIDEELAPDKSYRRARVTVLDDNATGRPLVVSATEGQLVSLCDRLSDAIGDDDGRLRELVREADSPGGRADLVCSALVSDPDERQRMLETLDPADRLDRMVELLARATAEMGQTPELLN